MRRTGNRRQRIDRSPRWLAGAGPRTIAHRSAATMANDVDWVAEVKRWNFPVRPAVPAVPVSEGACDIGYEAADPPLQSRNWPDTPSSVPTDLK